MSEQKPVVAIAYDFDGTLARGSLQDRSFIPDLLGIPPTDFWQEVRSLTNAADADEILVYMHLMLEMARAKGVDVTKAVLEAHGRDAPLFDGLADSSWFQRLNEFANEKGIALEHYIISSGIYEMIQGCRISNQFKHIFASKFLYRGNVAVWPSVAINFTTKTQYLFRINKGILDTWNHRALNGYMSVKDRRVPFSRMIFIGDGDTDIPSMKMITLQGGYAIAVYDPESSEEGLTKVHNLIADGRVAFVAPANFLKGTQLDISVKGILGRIAHDLKGQRPDF